MRKVDISQLRDNMKLELENLPLAITRYGEVIAVINYPGEPEGLFKESKIIAQVTKAEIKKTQKEKSTEVCKHGYAKGLCKYGC